MLKKPNVAIFTTAVISTATMLVAKIIGNMLIRIGRSIKNSKESMRYKSAFKLYEPTSLF